MASRKPAAVRNARQAEADSNFTFYNEGRGTVLDTEGETVGEPHSVEPELPPDTSAADAVTAQTALALIPIRFSVTDDHLAKLRQQAESVTFDTPEGYEKGRKLLQDLRSLAGATERTRETIKAPFWDTGKRIDAIAKGLTNQINEIREPLQALKDNADAERARRRRAAEDAERERVRLEAEAKLAAERAELEALRQEQARLAEEQRIAREAADARQAEERRAFEEERRVFAEAQAKLAEERMAVEQASAELTARVELVEAPSVARMPVSASTSEVAESWSASLAESRVSQSEIDAAIVESLPSLPPDRVDWVSPPALASDTVALADFARQIRALKSPAVTSELAGALIEQVETMLNEAAEALESFEQEAATAAE